MTSFAPQRLADVLIERSGGLWVYVTYALEQLRADPGQLDLAGLPQGLDGWYYRFWGRWKDSRPEGTWRTVDLPALATLAAAREDLTLSQLSLFARIDPPLRELPPTWLPYLTVSRAEPQRYRFYHASLARVARRQRSERVGVSRRRQAGVGRCDRGGPCRDRRQPTPGRAAARGGVRAAHVRVAVHDRFPAARVARELARGPAEHRPVDSGESACGRLAIEDPADRVDAVVAIAEHMVGEDREAALADGLVAAGALADMRRCLEAVALLAPLLSPALLSRAVDLAALITKPGPRAAAFVVLAARLTSDARALFDEGQRSAAAIKYAAERAATYAALAELVEGRRRTELQRAAITSARKVRDPTERVTVVAAQLEQLRGMHHSEARSIGLDAIERVVEPQQRARAVDALAPQLPAGERAVAVAAGFRAAAQVADLHHRGSARRLDVVVSKPPVPRRHRMSLHANARLSVKGRELLIDRVETDRYGREGSDGLLDRSSAPASVANRTDERRVEAIAALRRDEAHRHERRRQLWHVARLLGCEEVPTHACVRRCRPRPAREDGA